MINNLFTKIGNGNLQNNMIAWTSVTGLMKYFFIYILFVVIYNYLNRFMDSEFRK